MLYRRLVTGLIGLATALSLAACDLDGAFETPHDGNSRDLSKRVAMMPPVCVGTAPLDTPRQTAYLYMQGQHARFDGRVILVGNHLTEQQATIAADIVECDLKQLLAGNIINFEPVKMTGGRYNQRRRTVVGGGQVPYDPVANRKEQGRLREFYTITAR